MVTGANELFWIIYTKYMTYKIDSVYSHETSNIMLTTFLTFRACSLVLRECAISSSKAHGSAESVAPRNFVVEPPMILLS